MISNSIFQFLNIKQNGLKNNKTKRGAKEIAVVETAANRPKPQCKRKALSTMHYVYTAAIGLHVVAPGRLLINKTGTKMYLDDLVFHHRELG